MVVRTGLRPATTFDQRVVEIVSSGFISKYQRSHAKIQSDECVITSLISSLNINFYLRQSAGQDKNQPSYIAL
jgi:hypothetical protein